ncbi:glycosyltransferase family 2 protein [Microbacterium sp.]|uniref:glycosyltransferase family 2 protein n=1 Tax=Microbacterium sp. TaxID=51671 RepID=UPI003F9BE3AF
MAHVGRSVADVTVLVVAYRHTEHVVECLQSIEAQTCRPSRVIIADDCSPDETAAVITHFLDEHPGLAEYTEFHPNSSNIGLNRTLNKYLATVTTTYFTYISADDVMLPRRIERHLELLDAAPEAVLAYSDAIVLDRNSAVLEHSSQPEFPWPDSPHLRSQPFAELLHRNWMPAASLFLRTKVLQEEDGYREDLFYEDFELLVRLSKHHPFVWTDETLVGVRRLETSLGATGFSSTNPAFLIALDSALRHYDDAEPSLREKAAGTRWELAKRASRTSLAPRRSFALLWRARSGASSTPAFLRHLVAWGLLAVRRTAASAFSSRGR